MRRRRFGDLFKQVASLGNLFAAAKKALRGRGLKMPAVAFAADLETEVVALSHELRSGSYRPGAYHYFEIFEPKRRLVAAAPFRDRVVHHAICRVIEPIWERRFIADNYACRPGKGTHAAMRRASGAPSVGAVVRHPAVFSVGEPHAAPGHDRAGDRRRAAALAHPADFGKSCATRRPQQ
jgi:hypothetical protein